jgi:hypothetical protein
VLEEHRQEVSQSACLIPLFHLSPPVLSDQKVY